VIWRLCPVPPEGLEEICVFELPMAVNASGVASSKLLSKPSMVLLLLPVVVVSEPPPHPAIKNEIDNPIKDKNALDFDVSEI
jgi:hypothetical protein